MKSSLCMVLILVLCGIGMPVQAGDEEAEGNVRFTITIHHLKAGANDWSESHQVVCPVEGHSSLTMGSRVPIPTWSRPTGEHEPGEESIVTGYNYQTVGFAANLRTHPLTSGRLRVEGNLEVSRLGDGEQPGDVSQPPVVEAFDHRFEVVIADGDTLRLAQVAEIGSGSLAIDLQAQLLE